ncbi:hypothetical protein Rhopal_006636-T1 [Rhodotorula paludigena]|uniref:AAA+ ATPase domain-containing protein n=1 Tax=Rhodotorula paludigena TaxID=86838 RepID=A0AAV5GSV7_9BASI|nr:hypothetical protein Rhopal_006636-T1 [Rhodotorula paludigena]
MLLATQNPPGLYGGRKLKTILERRCRIASLHAEKTVNVFVELQRRRQAGRMFKQKQAFATLRDLFRCGSRGPVATVQQLAEDGSMLLVERARRADDKQTVKEVLEDVLKVKIDEKGRYDFAPARRRTRLDLRTAMRRLYFLIAASLQRHEPVLLVGETGAGKTSVYQALAHALTRQLHIVSCHQNTEVADLLGGQRPLRNRTALQAGLRNKAVALLAAAGKAAPTDAEGDFEDVAALVEAHAAETKDAAAKALATRMRSTTARYEWRDDRAASLADDSVLERLNSVLEPSRTLVSTVEILAIMNPGGDFGKKELSPALRNRFTEIWFPAVGDPIDLLHIIGSH